MRTSFFYTSIIALFVLCLIGCTEKVDESARYVFKDRTVADYLSSHEEYSEYLRLLGETPVSTMSPTTLRQLLSARGHYTVFAPTNDAIQAYLEVLVQKGGLLTEPAWDSFRSERVRDSIRRGIVMNSIVDSGDGIEPFYTMDFPTTQNAEFPINNMDDNRLIVHYGTSPDEPDLSIGNAPIDEKNRDILLTNGVLHMVSRVASPGTDTMGKWMGQNVNEKREGFYVASLLAKAVGMLDTLSLQQDETYEKMYQAGMFTEWANGGHIPAHRKYGFTYFAETDEFWSQAIGKAAREITVEDVVAYLVKHNVYPDAVNDQNYRNGKNLLNQFVTYHFLPCKLAPDQLVFHYNEYGYDRKTGELGCSMSEYYTTMGRRRLLKITESKESNGVYLNRFANLDNGRHGTYHEISCDADKTGVLIGMVSLDEDDLLKNGYVYPLNSLLTFDEQTRINMGTERIRIDASALCPEFLNNDIRMSLMYEVTYFVPNNLYKYLDDYWLSESTRMLYNTARSYLPPNLGNDEFLIYGNQDYILRLPPVPRRDTYELRYSCSNVPLYVGVFQIFFGENPDQLPTVGIPLDFRMGGLYYISGAESHMGWEADTEDDDYNAEGDKKLRNNGFMKAPNIYMSGSNPCRTDHRLTRRILVRQTMDPDKTYYLRLRNCIDVENSQLFFDYLEFCPKSVYDNPETPEDIW